jgi:hypothetical protein
MKLLLPLLIPTILLSSCSKVPSQSNEFPQVTNVIEIPAEAPPAIDIPPVSNETVPKDFWSGFLLVQTEDETTLTYNGKTVKAWSHTSEEVPFVWDEACTAFFNKLDTVLGTERAKNVNWKQIAWEEFGQDEQKKCLKEFLGNNGIYIQSLDDRFYKIVKSSYAWWHIWVYDTETGNMHEFQNDEKTWNIIESVEVTASGIVFNTDRSHGDDPPVRVTFDFEFTTILETIPQ